MQRERLGSRLGFILLSAGCAIGIGNVWKFPYVVGQYGGGAFVLIYLFFLIIMGVPVMTMEFSLGRASQKSAAKLYQQLEPKGTKWHIHGSVAVIGNYLLMMFYTSVTGWMLQYFVSMATGKFEGLDTNGVAQHFDNMLLDQNSMVLYMLIVVIIGFLVCSFGLKNGLERITKVLMIALLAIMVILAVNSIFMDGGEKGLAFYLLPDFNRMVEAGIGNVIVAAMNQAFFTLSLGMGAMAIFGSYIGKERSLMGEAVNVALLDTFVAFVSGLIIFPACFAYNVEAGSGPSLIFITLPNIFNNMPMGRIWGTLFFVFMSFAALSTIFTVFEGIISSSMDLFNWSRKKACAINAVLMSVLSLPCTLGFNLLSNIHPFGADSTIMDLEDFLVSNIILPLGSLVFILFCVSKKGWGWQSFVKEANTGKGIKVKSFMRGYMTYILPVIVFIIFAVGIYNFFK
ncbi:MULTISPECIES: sodium-dependent transporter [unclassified Ruminococcus]|uniref:sodium-dependent transporter n=1 Tax=unclassified Ruminococcus TaxID=2608920 RepID=UPI00210A795A|nr:MULTISPECIES: sodium-dependent transporter [unclassified Ruminococcus]MCQ4022055.1 sodium-dependent transporter [Ruminococcus sp. zg-924]MCQ4114375.1 sodium-dependent transporter [Ruminococcus sp. zg-921]